MDDLAKRHASRENLAIRRIPLAQEGQAAAVPGTPSERVAMVWPLTLQAWAMSGEPLPSYSRAETPGHIVRLLPAR